MTDPAFPPHISAALDRLTVPPVPHGFGDRLAARIASGDLPAGQSGLSSQLPSPRRRFGGNGWRRSGGIVAIAATFSLATATAAASGFFGEPVYVPVVSDALATAKLVELPKAAKSKVTPEPQAATGSKALVEAETQPSPNGRQAVRALYQRLHSDPEFRALPRKERLAIARQEIQTMVEKGEVTIPELRRALAERGTLQNPVIRQRIRRELVRRELQNQGADRTRMPVRDNMMPATAAQQQRIDPAKVEARREAFRQMPADQQARIRDLREQLRTASPAERRVIRQELRTIWQSQQNAPAEEKIETPSEGNSEVAR